MYRVFEGYSFNFSMPLHAPRSTIRHLIKMIRSRIPLHSEETHENRTVIYLDDEGMLRITFCPRKNLYAACISNLDAFIIRCFTFNRNTRSS